MPIDIVEDIAMLARKLAGKEPFASASGPEALLAFAAHLDEMVARTDADEAPIAPIVNVVVRSRRKKGEG